MSINDEENVNWKKLWQLTSGTHYDVPLDVVKTKLLEVTKELQSGILFYEKCSSSSADLEKFLKKKKQHKLFPFTNKLQQLLDLELRQLWGILCFYLLNEYRGSAYSLTQYISVENMTKLLDDIWGYYSMERITLLKIVKNILEFCNSKNHPYSSAYKHILDKLKLKNLRQSYIEQLEYLINENSPQKLTTGEFLNYQLRLVAWSERKMREMNEIIQIIILCVYYEGIEAKELHKLLQLFRSHSFGLQQRYIDSQNNEYHRDLVTKVMYGEIILFMLCLNVSENGKNESWISEVVNLLDRSMSTLQNNTECGPLLFIWMLFNYQLNNVLEDDIAIRKYQHFGIRAIKLNIFTFLKNLLLHQMFQNNSLVAKIARETIYNCLSYMCYLFNDNVLKNQHPGVYELFSELLSWPHIAAEFCTNENKGIRSLYNYALKYFPIDFIHLSDIAYCLLKAGKVEFVNSQLSALPIFATYYSEKKYLLKPSSKNGNEFVLINNVFPFNNDNLKIPESTAAIITRNNNNNQQEEQIVHFRTTYSYFNVLQNEINLLLNEIHTNIELNETHLNRINSGIKLLSAIIKNIGSLKEITEDIVQPIEMCVHILYKFKNLQHPPIKLFSYCLNVFTGLLPLFSNEILTRIINLNILPNVNNENLDYKKYAHGIGFDSSLIGSYLINIEKKMGEYNFLLSYLNFLREYLKLKRHETIKIEIPGLIFILREILPHIHSWQFRDINDKSKILIEVMKFICDILDTTTNFQNVTETVKAENIMEETKKNSSKKMLLRNICLYNLLNLDNGIVLLRFIAVGNSFLQTIMENESNWVIKQTQNKVILLVRLSMRILMQTLKLKGTIYDSSIISPLESLLYTQPKQRDTLRIIPMITSYMNNIFDKWLPILSCRLLRRIALELDMSLLACLDMEPDHIRLIFLQRLPDNLENDELKCAILEFVEACILKQPGLTEAFFKINISKEKQKLDEKNKNKIDNKNNDDKNKSEEENKKETEFLKSLTSESIEKNYMIGEYSILTFMNDYLINVSKNPYIIENSLHSRIMSIYHALWRNNMQVLAWDLISTNNFWSSICNPLFCDKLNTKERAYSQLYNILSLELFSYYLEKKKKQSDDFKLTLKRFYNKKYFNKWVDHIFNLPNIQNNDHDVLLNDEVPDWLVLLQSFKEFVIILLKNNINDFEIPHDNLRYLSIKCLNTLVESVTERQNKIPFIDLRSFITLVELYLHILIQSDNIYTLNDDISQQVLKNIVELLLNISSIYDSLHSRSRAALLSILIKISNLLSADLIQNNIIAQHFQQLIIDIISYELRELEKYVKDELEASSMKTTIMNDDVFYDNTFILSINLLKTVTIIFQNDPPGNWEMSLKMNKIIIRLLDCTSNILQNYSKCKLSMELLDVLIIFAKSSCSDEFLYCGISDYLWLKLIPPKELVIQSSITTVQSSSSLLSYELEDIKHQNQFQQQYQKQNIWIAREWWPIYQKGIELLTILLEKHKRQLMNDILIFVGVHEEHLIDSILLAKQSLEPNSMALIKTTLYFLTRSFIYEEEWKLQHSQSLINLVKCVQVILDHSISLLYRPKILKQFINKENIRMQQTQQQLEKTDLSENCSTTIFVDSLVQPMNDLIELIILSTKCLLKFSPTLHELICDPEFLSSKWESLIEIQFGAPKFNVTNNPQLTFGTILSAVAILTKALNLQNYEFHEIPMNMIPQMKSKKSDECGIGSLQSMQDKNMTSLIRSSRSPLKSVSVTSVTSLSSMSNEILSNLDSELCLTALEYILTLLASQSFLALKSEILSNREKQLIRREISNELSLFYDFVRRKMFIDSRGHRNIWQRKKHGIMMMIDFEDGEDEDDRSEEKRDNEKKEKTKSKQSNTEQFGMSKNKNVGSTSKEKDSMRINVVRRLHLNKQLKPTNVEDKSIALNISEPVSPIGSVKSKRSSEQIRNPVISSTPFISKQSSSIQNDSDEIGKRVRTDYAYNIHDDENSTFFPNEEPLYSPLSYVQFVEEDYLHFLSNLFHVICSVD